MKTDRLEEFIQKNREAFDQLEPSDKVWENIAKATGKKKIIPFRGVLLRVAAVVIFIVSFSVVIMKTSVTDRNNQAQSSDPELMELIETEAYYAGQVNEKMEEIKKCYTTNPEIKDEVESDLIELQDMYDVLRTDLRDNVSKKEVVEAMIENNRTRLKMVDEVIRQINC